MEIYNDHFCPNKKCSNYGKKGEGNIIFRRKYGKNETVLLKCKTCDTTFSERWNTVFYRLHTKEEKVIGIVTALAEGNGIRATARIFHTGVNTVRRILKKASEQCGGVSNHLMNELPVTECQLDELWSFVKKKREIYQNSRKSV